MRYPWRYKPDWTIPKLDYSNELIEPVGIYGTKGILGTLFLFGHGQVINAVKPTQSLTIGSGGVAPGLGLQGDQIFTSASNTHIDQTQVDFPEYGSKDTFTLSALMKFPLENTALCYFAETDNADGVNLSSGNFAVQRAGTSYSFSYAASSVSDGWHWVTVSFIDDTGAAVKEGRLYIDGIERGTRVTDGPIQWYTSGATVTYLNSRSGLGGRTRGIGACAALFFWDRVMLTDQQVLAHVKDPWAIFEPQIILTQVEAAAAAGLGIPIVMRHRKMLGMS